MQFGNKPEQRKQMLYHDHKHSNYKHKFGKRDTTDEVSLIGFGRAYEREESPGLHEVLKTNTKTSSTYYQKRQSTKDHLLQLELQRQFSRQPNQRPRRGAAFHLRTRTQGALARNTALGQYQPLIP